MNAIRSAVSGFAKGATLALAVMLALPCAAWPASAPASKPATKPAECRSVGFEDGTTARVRVSPSGSWSRCEYAFDLRLKAGANRKPLEVRSVTPDRCLIWVSEAALAVNPRLISQAWDLCIDSSHKEAEKEVATRK